MLKKKDFLCYTLYSIVFDIYWWSYRFVPGQCLTDTPHVVGTMYTLLAFVRGIYCTKCQRCGPSNVFFPGSLFLSIYICTLRRKLLWSRPSRQPWQWRHMGFPVYRFSKAALREQRMLILIMVLLQMKCKFFCDCLSPPRGQAIAWPNIDQDPWDHMASLCHNGLNETLRILHRQTSTSKLGNELTLWGRNKFAAILQMAFSNAFLMKMYEFR